MKRALLWGGSILGIVFFIVLLAKLGSATTTPGTLSGPIGADEHIKGNPEAQVTLVEYSDFQCPACASYYPMVKQLADEYKDQIRIVYRHYPLRSIHPNADLAGRAAEAAADQGKFWEMHDMLFNTQRNWSSLGNPKDHFIGLATSLELDVNAFTAALESDDTQARVNEDVRTGNSAGVSGTPTFFLNGQKITNPQSYEQLKSHIDTALRAQ